MYNMPMAVAAQAHMIKALVVDDDPKILVVYQELLARRGFAVTACADSAQALSQVRGEAFHIVLLDVRMPGLEGTDLLPLIKRFQPKLPVIIVSAYCDEASKSYYHAMGAFEAISKPFSQERLLDAVDRALAKQESIPLALTSLSLQEGREQVYRKLILAALQRTGWNQVRSAELLGVSRYCLIRWMKKLGLSSSS